MTERAGQGWCVVEALMPCRVRCGAKEKGVCTSRNANAILSVQSMHGRGQCVGWGVAYRRHGRRPAIGHRRWWPEGPVGEVAMGGLPPTLQSPWACAGVASGSERERGLARVGTGRWGPGVSPGRWIDADWGCRVERVSERGGQDLGQDLRWELPLPCVQPHKTRIIRGRERCQQGREKGGRLGLPLGRFAKRERRKEKRRRRNSGFGRNSFEI
jgi:hypothetical protein